MQNPEPIQIVNLIDREDLVKKYAPDAQLLSAQYGRGIQIVYHVKIQHEYVRTPSEKDADELIRALINEMQSYVIRGMGLKPQIDSYLRQIRDLEVKSHNLTDLAQSRARRIVELQEELDTLRDRIRSLVEEDEA